MNPKATEVFKAQHDAMSGFIKAVSIRLELPGTTVDQSTKPVVVMNTRTPLFGGGYRDIQMIFSTDGTYLGERELSKEAREQVKMAAAEKAQTTQNELQIIMPFFGSGPCFFDGCDKLREAYKAELEKMGGEKCTACARGSLNRKYIAIVKQHMEKQGKLPKQEEKKPNAPEKPTASSTA
jgi:hypothetical protein